MTVYAHSENDSGERHLLVDHLRAVAGLASELAGRFGGGGFCFLAGLWHDVGKADPLWQKRLFECERGERTRVGVDHKCAGALLAEGMGDVGRLVGLLIQGHHGGLRALRGFGDWLEEKRCLPGPGEALRVLRSEMDNLAGCGVPTLPGFVGSRRDVELFLRFCFSALVDADSLDTEAHSLGGVPPDRGSVVSLADLWNRYEGFLAGQAPGSGQRRQSCTPRGSRCVCSDGCRAARCVSVDCSYWWWEDTFRYGFRGPSCGDPRVAACGGGGSVHYDHRADRVCVPEYLREGIPRRWSGGARTSLGGCGRCGRNG